MKNDTAYNDILLYYAQKHLTSVQLEKIRGILLYGPNGLRRWLGNRDIEAFIKLYFPDEFTLPFAPIHYQMLQDMQQVRDRLVAGRPGIKLARAIPRNHSKTTFYARILPLHGFLYGWSRLTVLLGNNDDSARRLTQNIKACIEGNEAIQQDFPDVKGSSWGIERLENNNNGALLTSYGTGSGSVRGISSGQHRPSLIVADDIDDDRSVRSAVELANNIEWWDKAISALGDNVQYTTSFIATGTLIRKTSLLRYILDSPDYHSIIECRVKNFAINEHLWNVWQEQYMNLARNNQQPKDASEDVFYQQHKVAMLAGTHVLWDKKDDYYYAMVYRLARGSKAFQSEMQNDPVDDGNLLGDVTKVSALPVDLHNWQLIAALDSSIKGNETNDPSAWVELVFSPHTKQMIVSYVDSRKRSYATTINDVAQRINDNPYRYAGIFVETNSAGEIIADEIQNRIAQKYYNVTKIYNSLPKNERIGVLTQYIENKQLTFFDGVQQQLFTELTEWPMKSNVHHFDTIDALSMIVAELKSRGLLQLIGE